MTEITIEEGVRSMIDSGEESLRIYWLEDISEGEDRFWLDVCEDRLGEICEMNWVWDLISKSETEADDDPESEYGCLESDIIVDELFSEDVVKRAVEGWLKDREFDINVEVISSEGTVAEQRILNAIESARDELGGFT